FDSPHPAATRPSWRADLALVKSEDFLAAAAEFPAKAPGFQFDACLEFAYLPDFYTLPVVRAYGEPEKGQDKVREDVNKICRYVSGGVCRTGYVIFFEDCDSKFPPSFVADAEEKHGCRVRFVRGS